jgi:uncharacterized surface protein with fasciclin (FAS1) repeats
MDTNFRSRLLRVLIASAIVGSVAGWLYPKRNTAAAADCYCDNCCGCNPRACPKNVDKLRRTAALALGGLVLYEVKRAAGGIRWGGGAGRLDSSSLWKVTQSKPDEFGALIKILRNTDETETYQKSGPYTVFWPTEAALSKALGAERVALLQSAAGQQDARHFIASLTVSGSFSLQRLRALATEGKTLTTLTRERIVLKLEGDRLAANGITLLQSEYPAHNGFIIVTEGIVAREP